MHPINEAQPAATIADDGDTAGARVATARRHARRAARRDRQIAEIASLVVDGQRARAAGLALEHIAEFPDDADLLGHVSAATRP